MPFLKDGITLISTHFRQKQPFTAEVCNGETLKKIDRLKRLEYKTVKNTYQEKKGNAKKKKKYQ